MKAVTILADRVIAVFRKYWLACDELNVRNEEEDDEELIEEDFYYVNPKDFTVDWLSGDRPDLYKLILSMPYYPIGIDEEGNDC